MAEETVILNFEVDQGKAEKDLIAIQQVIINNKKEQAELNKAYKAGTLTQKEYLTENLRLQQNLKKEQEQTKTLTKLINTESNSRNAIKARISALVKEYDNLNVATATGAKREKELAAELTNLNNQISKTSKNAGLFKDQIGNYPQAFQQAASKIQVAGVSVGDIGTKLAAFATPAGAVIGVLGALGAAYARSTAGAKDLEFAQSQLSELTTLVTNKFGDLVSSSEDGEGALSKLLNRFLELATAFSIFGITDLLGLTDAQGTIDKSKELAKIAQELEDLGREENRIRAENNERLEENQELLTQIADENRDINLRIADSAKITENLTTNQTNLLAVKNKQLAIVNKQLDADRENEAIQDRQGELTKEISKIQTETTKKIQANNRAQDNLNQLLVEELRLRKLVSELEERRATGADVGLTNISASNLGVATADETAPSSQEDQQRSKDLIEGNAEFELNVRANLNAGLLKMDKDLSEKEVRNKRLTTEAKIAADKATLAATAQIAGEASELFDEETAAYKVLASAQTLISTYTSAQLAFQSLAGIPFVGPALGAAAAGIAIAQGLKRVADINGIEFAEGGYTGPGRKYDIAGTVHKGEYVAPKHVVESSAGKPHIAALERMRTGYADGGFVTNQNIAQAQQSLIMANALRSMPAPVVSVVEINRGQKRVAVRENQARI